MKALLRRAAGGAASRRGARRRAHRGRRARARRGRARGRRYDGRDLDLTPREFELLACLMRHRGKVLSREQLLKQAWGWEIVVETKTVDTHVKRLRDKLEAGRRSTRRSSRPCAGTATASRG